MKMTETDLILSFRGACEEMCTVDAPNANSDVTGETAGQFVQEPRKSINDEVAKNADVPREVADRRAAGNFKSVQKSCGSYKVKVMKDANGAGEEDDCNSDQVKRQSSRARAPRRSRESILAYALIKRSIKCLSKMHVMEDVHDGCNAQPSSPGHADQRPEIMQMCAEKEPDGEVAQNDSDKDVPIAQVKLESDAEETQTQIKTEDAPPDAKMKESSTDNDANHINDDSISSDSVSDNALKRKIEAELTSPSPSKKLQLDIQKNFLIRDTIISSYLESLGCGSLGQIQNNTEQILTEIKSLNEMAKQKEREWNNILHMKKLKEELLLRLQRHKQLLLLNNEEFETEANFDPEERYQNNEHLPKRGGVKKLPTNLHERGQLCRQRNFNGRPSLYNYELNGQSDNRQNRQRPLKDVKSIIADYRQKHPETVPRRGRRIRSVLSHDSNSSVSKCETSGVLNLSNIALGSGAQVRHNTGVDINKDLGLLLNVIGESRKESSQSPNIDLMSSQADPTSFKDMLIEFAKLSQTERQEILHNAVKPPPPPYPEVTVHPVPTSTASNSLLHGILTKTQSKPENKSTFSPTLARLLTAPEKSAVMPQAPAGQSSNMLQSGIATISDILSSSKARNEITITPVVGQYDVPMKVKQAEEDEAEDSADRLVIDEGGEMMDARSRTDNNSDAGDEVPQCQGCNQKPAQFVCAGCGNQWYCSRDCQVSAWDEHSEMCSG